MVQRRAARFVANNYSRSDGTVTNILRDLEWSNLQERRKNTRLAIMFKIHSDDITIPIPEYIKRQTATQTRQYHPKRFQVVKASTNVYKYSFFPATIFEWNSLPSSIIDSNTVENFKTGLGNI